MPTLYTVEEVLAATGGRAQGITGRTIGSISIDSRELGPEALFVAIKGDRFDGHDFVDTALANGAVAALVSDGRSPGDQRIVVPDALEGLCDLARAARARNHGVIVGVTGSVGKTTTKEAIRLVFEAAGRTHASIESFNNHWGVPLMLARMPADTQFGVFEMGMSGPDEIRPLSTNGAPPYRGDHQCGGRASGGLRLARWHCPRQGRDLCRDRTRRHRGAQCRSPAIADPAGRSARRRASPMS